MTTYMFKSFPANRSCNINLAEIEKQYHIFTTAVDKCNAGITFRKDGKKFSVYAINESSVTLVLTSETELSSPARTMSAFSRELLRLNTELKKEKNTEKIIDDMVYNHSLFRTEMIDKNAAPVQTIENISSTELIKSIVDLLFSSYTGYSTNQKKETIDELKKIMLPYIN